jgi:hypothetical protein
MTTAPSDCQFRREGLLPHVDPRDLQPQPTNDLKALIPSRTTDLENRFRGATAADFSLVVSEKTCRSAMAELRSQQNSDDDLNLITPCAACQEAMPVRVENRISPYYGVGITDWNSFEKILSAPAVSTAFVT